MMSTSLASLDYHIWAWQHTSPSHVTVEMHKFMEVQQQQQQEQDDRQARQAAAHHNALTWNKIASAIANNPYISSVQLDMGAVTDQVSLQAMVDAIASLPNLHTLHVKPLVPLDDAQSVLALQLVHAVVAARRSSSTPFRHLHVEGLTIANDASARLFCALLQNQTGVSEYTWSNLRTTNPLLDEQIAQAWNKNTSWSAWRLVGHIPLSWIAAAAHSTAAASPSFSIRTLEMESVTTHQKALWKTVQALLCHNAHQNWRVHVRAMNLNGRVARALDSCRNIVHLSLMHCCVDATFSSLSQLAHQVPSVQLVWNRIEDERQLVDMVQRIYSAPHHHRHQQPRNVCIRQNVVVHHHWTQVFDWDLVCPSTKDSSNLAALVGPSVQWKGTRWPAAVARRLDFYQFLRQCQRKNYSSNNNTKKASSWMEHTWGSSVLFHTLRQDPSILYSCYKDDSTRFTPTVTTMS